jgi:hypothetical protein
LDKLGRNIQALDVGIESVRKPAKGEKPSDKRPRLKLLRDLIELQNASMAMVKAHLLARDETGSVNEPEDHYSEYAVWEFERDFKRHLEPWTQKDIEFECEDCGVESEEVYRQTFSHPYPQEDEHFYLCDKCYEKRTTQQSPGKDDSAEADATRSDMKVDLSTPEKCQEMIQKVKALEAAGQLGPAEAKAMIGTIQNALSLFGKQGTVGSTSA